MLKGTISIPYKGTSLVASVPFYSVGTRVDVPEPPLSIMIWLGSIRRNGAKTFIYHIDVLMVFFYIRASLRARRIQTKGYPPSRLKKKGQC